MSSKWRTVSGETAQRHELYGVGGWLAWFAVTIALGLLRDLGSISGEASKIGMTMTEFLSVDHPAVIFLRWVLAIEVIMLVAIYYMMAVKVAFFRIATTWILVGVIPAVIVLAVFNSFDGAGEVLVQTVFVQGLYCLIWCTYLNLSKRVRVTFEHQVLSSTLTSAEIEAEPDTLPAPPTAPVAPAHSLAPTATPVAVASATAPSPAYPAAASASAAPAAPVPPTATPHIAPSPAPVLPVSAATLAQQPDNDEQLWEAAAQEFDSPARRPGLWAKSFAQSGGNEVQAKVHYLKVRVSQLVAERVVQREAELVARRGAKPPTVDTTPATPSSPPVIAPVRPALGVCPSCSNTIPADSKSCPKCKASFDEYSSWRVKPLGS